MSKAQKGNKEKKKPKADKNQPKTHVSAYKAAQGQGKPSFNPFARKTRGRHDPDHERSATAYGKNRTARIAFASSELAVFADRCPIDQLKHVIVRAGGGCALSSAREVQ